jgi:hypothetical protein
MAVRSRHLGARQTENLGVGSENLWGNAVRAILYGSPVRVGAYALTTALPRRDRVGELASVGKLCNFAYLLTICFFGFFVLLTFSTAKSKEERVVRRANLPITIFGIGGKENYWHERGDRS